jgi:hypothetical protein
MFAFFIILAISIGGAAPESHDFHIWSSAVFDQPACMAAAKETAVSSAKFTAEHVPGAEVSIKYGCFAQETFPS